MNQETYKKLHAVKAPIVGGSVPVNCTLKTELSRPRPSEASYNEGNHNSEQQRQMKYAHPRDATSAATHATPACGTGTRRRARPAVADQGRDGGAEVVQRCRFGWRLATGTTPDTNRA